MNPMYFFMTLVIIVTIVDLLVAVLCFKKDDKRGKILGICSIAAAIVCLAYGISASTEKYKVVSVFSSIYFFGIDIVLLFFLNFISVENTNRKPTPIDHVMAIIVKIWFFVEFILFFINIFVEIEVSYVKTNSVFAMYEYDMKPLYYIHLAYTYLLVLLILVMLATRTLKIPHEYKRKYTTIIHVICVIIVVNGLFLFVPKKNLWFEPDYAVLLYSIAISGSYWATYYYTKKSMLSIFREYIFDSIDQGLLLFDFENHIILKNEKLTKLLPSAAFNEYILLDDFLSQCNIMINTNEEAYSVQCYIDNKGTQKPLRCDYKKLRNDKDQVIGRLLVFADAQLDTDLLTGFHSWESFRKWAADKELILPKPTTVAVCDLNRLAMYNTIHGRSAGDKLIKSLAETLHKIFQDDAYYVRGNNASLIAICYNQDEKETIKELQYIQSEFEQNIQFSVAEINEEHTSIIDTILEAYSGLKAKKLLDTESARSALIRSLVKALEECDPNTEAHVERTRNMGAELGKRIGLSDVEQSRLSLLCLLHDIGKIGVPLDILNKPGKLTNEEWELIKTHATKGETIAQSTPELTSISEYIRSHHERWDGRGYPDGLSRETIPLLSRIIAIVDAFDAMVNNRSYRKAKTIDEAKEEIRKNAGTQFDPAISAEFLKMLDEGYHVVTNTDDDTIVNETVDRADDYQIEEVDNNFIHPLKYSKYILNTDNIIISIDKAFTELTGYTMEYINEHKLTQWDLLPEEDRTDYISTVTKQMANSPTALIEHRIVCLDKTIKYVYCMGKVFFDSTARAERIEIIVSDFASTYSSRMLANSVEQKAQTQLKHWEDTYRKDSLTNLLTHRAMVSDIEQAAINNKDDDIIFLMIDLDNFKGFNDTYGHLAGDEYLIKVAEAIKGSIREKDLAARMGGDEFMIAAFINKGEDYKSIAKKIFERLTLKLSILDRHTTFSMGVAIKSDKLDTFNKLYEASDKGLYKSKNTGRNRVTFYENEDGE